MAYPGKEYMQKYRETHDRSAENHTPAARARKTRWRWNNREANLRCIKRADVKRKFGISLEDYEARLVAQQGVCALCKKPFYGEGSGMGAPALDHCHSNNQVREFIHMKCNMAIGHFGDDAATCRLAAEYLERHSQGD